MTRTATPDTSPADVLTPYTVTAGMTRAYRVCWIGYEALEPGTTAFADGEGGAVCVGCAVHATSCTDEDCELGHPLYAYDPQGS